MERTLDDWVAEATAELGLELEVDIRELLDLARVVAHGVARPAAPLTAFLIGYAAATRGGGPARVTAASRQIAALAERWAAAEQPTTQQQQPTEPKPTEPKPTEPKPSEQPPMEQG